MTTPLIDRYHNEIDLINSRINDIISPPPKNCEIPTHYVFIYILTFAFLIFILTKLEWKTLK